MDEDTSIPRYALSILGNLVEGRNVFFSRDFQINIPFESRANIISRYMSNEMTFIDVINRINMQNTQLQNAVALLNVTLPNPNNFLTPVHVYPTRAQITSSLQTYAGPSSSNCAICQELISSGGCRIRQCGHVYHRGCIENWFSMSVRCPVCRHDIREEHPANRTSSDVE